MYVGTHVHERRNKHFSYNFSQRTPPAYICANMRSIIAICAICLLLFPFANGSDNSESLQQSIFPTVVFPRVIDPIATQKLETPIQVRCFFYLNMAVWNAWSNYHPTAVDIFGRASFKRPQNEHTTDNKNTAILYSLFRLYQKTPESCGGDSKMTEFRKIFEERGLNPDDMSTDMTSPAGIGNREGLDTARLMALDGWNSAGNVTGSAPNYKLPFQDYTGYEPKNSPWDLKYPFRWQPVLETDKRGFFFRQEHVVPQLSQTMMFSLTRKQANKRRVKPLYKYKNAMAGKENKQDLISIKRYAREVFNRSAQLTERERVMAEFFDNKIKSFDTDRNPGGALSIAAALRFVVLPSIFDWSMDDDIIYGMSANMLTMDSVTLSWREKVRHDNVRPTGQTMKHIFGEKQVNVWGGPEQQTVSIRPEEWQPYIRTMPHSEYPSGTACLCSALVEEAYKTTNGRDDIPFSVTIPQGSSKFYPGKVPSKDFKINIPSLSKWKSICIRSRLFAGVHFRPSLSAGKNLCKGIGSKAHDIVNDMLSGQLTSTWTNWLPENTEKFWETDL